MRLARKRFFSHFSPNGDPPMARVRRTGFGGGSGWRIGETIGWGAGSTSTPASIVRAWLASASHREAILGPYSEAGVGVARGRPSGRRGSTRDVSSAIYVLDLGSRTG